MRFHFFFFFSLQVQRELNGSLIQKQPPSWLDVWRATYYVSSLSALFVKRSILKSLLKDPVQPQNQPGLMGAE